MKKFFSLVLALVMALSLTTVAWGAPVADTAAAQATLDAATDGTTIQLAPDVAYGALTVVPTANSNTTYECNAHGAFTDAAAFQAHMAEAVWHGTPTYTTTLKNLTIVGAEGATVAGFVASSGHAHGTVHDYVLNKDYTNSSAYYFILKIENLKFQNVNFTEQVNICTSQAESVYDGVTFDGCTFTTGGTASSNGAAIRYYNENNNGNVKNLTVMNCSFEDCYQGVYAQRVNGVTVTDCSFDTTGHNAISNLHSGAIKVEIIGNTFKNIGDRVIRFGEVGADSNITINNNIMVNSGDEDGELIKAESVDSAADVNLESNYWDGKDAATAVASFEAPTVVGITGGTWDTDMNAYAAPGSALVQDTNGNWIAGTAVTMGDKFDLYLANAGMNTALKLETPTVAGLSFTEVAAKTNKDGSGNVAYIAANNGQYFVKTSAPTVADYAVTDAGKNTVLYYVTVAGTSAANFAYEESVAAFDKFSTYAKCDYVTGTPVAGKSYFMASDDLVYMAGAAGTGTNYLLNGKVVSGTYAGAPETHTFVLNGYKYDTTLKQNVPTSALCTKCMMNTGSIYLRTKVPATYTLYTTTGEGSVDYTVALPGTATVVPSVPSTDVKVESAATFDAGIAMYVGMSVLAATGSAVVIGKKKEF